MPKSNATILWVGFFGAIFQIWFMLLEGVIVSIAIHNQHYSIYYSGFAIMGLLLSWQSHRWRKQRNDFGGWVRGAHVVFLFISAAAFACGLVLFLFELSMRDAWSVM